MPEMSSLAAVVDQDGEVQILALVRAFCAGEPFDGKVFQQPPDTQKRCPSAGPGPGCGRRTPTWPPPATSTDVSRSRSWAGTGRCGTRGRTSRAAPGQHGTRSASLRSMSGNLAARSWGGTRTDGWSSSPWRPEPSGTAGSREPGRVLDTTGCRCGTLPAAGSPWRHRRSRSTMTVAWSWASIRAMRLVGGRSARSSRSPRR